MTMSSNRRRRIARRHAPARRFPAPAAGTATVVTRYALQDNARHRIERWHGRMDALVQLGNRHHYRLQAREQRDGGWYEFCGVSEGLFTSFGAVSMEVPQPVYLSFPDVLQICVASNGEGEYVFPDGDRLAFEAPNAALFLQPADAAATEVTFAGTWRYFTLSVHREALKSLYAGDETELPATIRAFLNGTLERNVGEVLPLRGAILRCLDDVHACGLEGRSRRLFLQSKAVEVLCQAIEALHHVEGMGMPETTMLTVRSVVKAQRLLAENFAAPPSLEDLALQVGLSRSCLCAGFRQILGRSVFDYILELRMQRALAMLTGRNASIAQIAHAVGYNRPSSFSVAVQRHFGATPSELRRRSALPQA